MAGLTDPLILVPGHPVRLLRYRHLKPCPLARLAGLSDGDAGDIKNFPCEEEPKPGVLPESPLEYFFLLHRQECRCRHLCRR